MSEDLEHLAVDLAQGAAAVVRAGRRGDLTVSVKSTDTDLVTEVDRATERWLVGQLADRRPGDGVLGEEGGDHVGRTGVRWILDPIDGTVNFVLDIPQYAVSVAAEVEGVVVAGAVCNPASGELFHARRGGGAHLDGRRLAGPREVPLRRAVVGTGFSYEAAVRAKQVAALGPMLAQIADLRRLGGAALDLCFLAAGRLDAYFESGLNQWDHAAGGLIATEAGCVASGLHGRPPSKQLYAVAGATLAPAFFGLLESVRADEVNS
jgi:myo-inositol-1(or 4)-monophosphatase